MTHTEVHSFHWISFPDFVHLCDARLTFASLCFYIRKCFNTMSMERSIYGAEKGCGHMTKKLGIRIKGPLHQLDTQH